MEDGVSSERGRVCYYQVIWPIFVFDWLSHIVLLLSATWTLQHSCFVIICCYQRFRIVSCWLLVAGVTFFHPCSLLFPRFITYPSTLHLLLIAAVVWDRMVQVSSPLPPCLAWWLKSCLEHWEVRRQSWKNPSWPSASELQLLPMICRPKTKSKWSREQLTGYTKEVKVAAHFSKLQALRRWQSRLAHRQQRNSVLISKSKACDVHACHQGGGRKRILHSHVSWCGWRNTDGDTVEKTSRRKKQESWILRIWMTIIMDYSMKNGWRRH